MKPRRFLFKKLRRPAAWAAAGAFMLVCLGWAGWSALLLTRDPLAEPSAARAPSTVIEDRRGREIGRFLSQDRAWIYPAALDDVSPHLIHAALAAEDKRFFHHPGVDPLAMVRAMSQAVRTGRIVSGASTITMQLARLLDPGPRTLAKKIKEAVVALRLERFHSKEKILEEYLNRVPCGNLASGLPAAALVYFDKEPSRLSPAEAAFLMALPQAPSRLNPYRGTERALIRRNAILRRMAALGFLTDDQARRAQGERLRLTRKRGHFKAPHFFMHLATLLPENPPARVRTTLDLELQDQVQRLLTRTVALSRGKGITQAAAVILDHQTGQVLAWAGSADFRDPLEGQNDGVLALRQPGSAVKPFTYAAALDAGWRASDLLEDKPVDFGLAGGVYSPSNYDERFRGLVDLRTALASSLNVPAVRLLDQVGYVRVHRLMRAAGLKSLDKEPDYYGLGLTLGSGEVSLLELASAYATLASGGTPREPRLFLDRTAKPPAEKVFSPQAAYIITDILSDDAARAAGFGRDSLLVLPFPVAAKTGTSKNFRDNWCVGYTNRVVAAVWAGNFDARPMGRVSGISGAGPLWRQVMRLAAAYYPPGPFTRPEGLVEIPVCADSGLRAGPDCLNQKLEIFIKGHEPEKPDPDQQVLTADRSRPAPTRPVIANPRPGERYLFDPGIENGFQNLALEADGLAGADLVVWKVNGREVGRRRVQAGRAPALYWPLSRGEATIELAAMAGGRIAAADRISITVH